MRQTEHYPPDFTRSLVSADLLAKLSRRLDQSYCLGTQKQQQIMATMQITGERAIRIRTTKSCNLRQAQSTKKVVNMAISAGFILPLMIIKAMMRIMAKREANLQKFRNPELFLCLSFIAPQISCLVMSEYMFMVFQSRSSEVMPSGWQRIVVLVSSYMLFMLLGICLLVQWLVWNARARQPMVPSYAKSLQYIKPIIKKERMASASAMASEAAIRLPITKRVESIGIKTDSMTISKTCINNTFLNSPRQVVYPPQNDKSTFLTSSNFCCDILLTNDMKKQYIQSYMIWIFISVDQASIKIINIIVRCQVHLQLAEHILKMREGSLTLIRISPIYACSSHHSLHHYALTSNHVISFSDACSFACQLRFYQINQHQCGYQSTTPF